MLGGTTPQSGRSSLEEWSPQAVANAAGKPLMASGGGMNTQCLACHRRLMKVIGWIWSVPMARLPDNFVLLLVDDVIVFFRVIMSVWNG
jgi:hypothetical protein